MMASTVPTHFKFKPPKQDFNTHFKLATTLRTTTKVTLRRIHPKPPSFFARVSGDDDFSAGSVSAASDIGLPSSISPSSAEGYVGLFVRMLGSDNDPLDREQAVDALWKYSLGGKQYVDAIMQFRGSINLIVNLLQSDSSSTCEAASGLLRMISSVNSYRDLVAESGAIEGITALLSRLSLNSDVKEQSISTLWNLSVDEKLQTKIANSDLLPLLIKFLEDEHIKVKEAAGGVVANLTLSHSNHKLMVEAGVIPKLAKLLKTDVEGSKVIRKEARNALLELAKDEYYRVLVMEEGLILVPLVGADAYKSFRPALHSWPSLPDGIDIEQNSKGPSRYGASELLLGLNIEERNAKLEEAKMKAIVGRTQQHFLARVGAIEMENDRKSERESSSDWHFTILPWMDGVARLVLILGLEDESAIVKASEAIAAASISEHMRVAFKEAGAVRHLAALVDHPSRVVRLAVVGALERLSASNDVCRVIEAEGILNHLIDSLKQLEVSDSLMEKTLTILARILDPDKEIKSKFYEGRVNWSKQKQVGIRTTASPGNVSETSVSELSSSLQSTKTEDLLNSSVLTLLVDIMKKSPPNLQRQAASILEYVTVTEPSIDKLISADIESGLHALFQQVLNEAEAEEDQDIDYDEHPQQLTLQLEESGHAVSTASRLLTRLLDFEHFQASMNTTHFIKLLTGILKSNIPLHYKHWVSACLVKLSSISGPNLDYENPIRVEVALYGTIPRLIQQIKSLSPQVQESAVVELNRIISEGMVDSTRAVAAEGGIFPLVKVIEEGTDEAVEAGLAILYNLSMDVENHSAMVAAGAVPALRRIVLSQRPQWMRALHVLRTLPT